MDQVSSLRKIPTRFCGTNFCTSLTHFALRVVRQPKGPKCTRIVRNSPKFEFRVQWGGLGALVAKNSDATSRHELFAPVLSRFVPSFVRQPNSPKCTQIVENRPKDEFRVQWGGSGAFIVKKSDTTFVLIAQFGPF